MSDPLSPAAAGDISPFITSISTVNAVLGRVRSQLPPNPPKVDQSGETDPVSPRCTVFIRNDTGATLPEFSVVALGAPLILVADAPFAVQRQPLFPGTTPAADSDAFAVLMEPLTADKIGRATVLGVAVCDVWVAHGGTVHSHATPRRPRRPPPHRRHRPGPPDLAGGRQRGAVRGGAAHRHRGR